MRFDIMYERDRQTDTHTHPHTPSHTRTPHDGKGREKNHTGMTAAFHIVEELAVYIGQTWDIFPVGHSCRTYSSRTVPPPGQLPSPPRS